MIVGDVKRNAMRYKQLCCTCLLLLSFVQISESRKPFIKTENTIPEYLLEVGNMFKKSNDTSCPNECSSQGRCDNGHCTCFTFYSGDSCEIRWREDHPWFGFWTFYFILVILMHLIGMAWSCYNLYVIKDKITKLHWQKWPISAYITIIFLAASFVRVLSYSIDPQNERQTIGNIADSILFNISIILWLSGGCLMFLFWIEIQRVSNIAALNSVQKLRPVLIGFIVVIIAVIFPASIAVFITDNLLLILIYNFFLSLIFVTFIVVLTLAGINLMRVLRELTQFKSEHGNSISQRDTIFQVFLAKISWFILYLDVVLVCLIITLALFEALEARQHKWTFLIIHLFLRLEEMAVVVCVNMFVMKKKPKGVDGTLMTQTASMECYPIDSSTRISLPQPASQRSEL